MNDRSATDPSSSRIDRRGFCRWSMGALAASALPAAQAWPQGQSRRHRPNVVMMLSDDVGLHKGAYGSRFVHTPAFDRVASEGALFHRAHASSASCGPSRASMLTGRHVWQNGEGGVHLSVLPDVYPSYIELLHEAGYHCGLHDVTFKPGRSLRSFHPPGTQYKAGRGQQPAESLRRCLADREPGQPFHFWATTYHGHGPWEAGIGLGNGKKLADVDMPPYLPDNDLQRSWLLDYGYEIDVFDREVAGVLAVLEEIGEFDNTIVVVSSDNGINRPMGKGMGCYGPGTAVPLAIRWGERIAPGTVSHDLVSLTDLAPTFLEAAGIEPMPTMVGRPLSPIFDAGGSGRLDPARGELFTGFEVHSRVRPATEPCYPVRSILTERFHYIWNLEPDRDFWGQQTRHYRWFGPPGDPIPRMAYHHGQYTTEFHDRLMRQRRPDDELYDVRADPGYRDNLADDPSHDATRRELRDRLESRLRSDGDPRLTGNGEAFEHAARHIPSFYFNDSLKSLGYKPMDEAYETKFAFADRQKLPVDRRNRPWRGR